MKDTEKPIDTPTERRGKNQSLTKRLKHEEDTLFRRTKSDPEFTVEDLVKMTGYTAQHVRSLLRGAGMGFPTLRPRPNGGAAIKTITIRWSQLKKLAKEFKWDF